MFPQLKVILFGMCWTLNVDISPLVVEPEKRFELTIKINYNFFFTKRKLNIYHKIHVLISIKHKVDYQKLNYLPWKFKITIYTF